MVTISLAVHNGNTEMGANAAGANKAGEKEGQVKNGSIFAGNLNNMKPDRMEQKREEARKQAAKLIMDQFASDMAVKDGLDEMRSRIDELRQEVVSLNHEKKEYEDARDGLMEKYGITEDSQEHQDLELIKKAKKPGGIANLNEEEVERLANMGELTDYQSEVLYHDEMIEDLDRVIVDYDRQIKGLNSGIKSIRQALLEDCNGMANAQTAAGKILKSAAKSIIDMAWADAREQIDKEFEELVEAAKEAAKKKEEEEEKLDEIKEEKKEQEELTEAVEDSVSGEGIPSEIKKILKEAELLKEDMKGLVVDGQC